MTGVLFFIFPAVENETKPSDEWRTTEDFDTKGLFVSETFDTDGFI